MGARIENETELIQTYLAPLAAAAPGALGLRDDASYLTPPPGADLVITTDPIAAGLHFLASDRADDIAWKALAVNISDLAAKGAVPLAYTMALALPAAPERSWMEQFALGLAGAQQEFGCTLIGGDTDRTRGPLTVSITAIGAVPHGRMVQRTTARVGDYIFVTGTLGDAALGLELHRQPQLLESRLLGGERSFLVARYLRPAPRLALSPLLRAYASAALDISDGLAKDLGRLVKYAGGRVVLRYADLPVSPSAAGMIAADGNWRRCVVAGGDDYELLFAVPADAVDSFLEAAEGMPFQVTEIGRIEPGSGVAILDSAGQPLDLGAGGWDHFA